MSRVVRILFLILFQISLFGIEIIPAHAVIAQVGYHTYYSSEEPELSRLHYLIDPGDFKADFDPYRDVSAILFLGDGFNKTDYSLTEIVGSIVSKDTKIYRSDIECTQNEVQLNIVSCYANHQRPLPWDDDQFDTIVLRRGLCHCHSCEISCGGILNDFNSMKKFIFHVSRVLNKKNHSSSAFLHGETYSFCEPHKKIFMNNLERAIQSVKYRFPELRYTLVHRYISKCSSCISRLLSNGVDPNAIESEFIGVVITIF